MLFLGGNDRSLRLFSVVKDSTSCELSQGMYDSHSSRHVNTTSCQVH